MSGALHHFAITGRAQKEEMLGELGNIYETSTDEEIRLWAVLLALHIANPQDPPSVIEQPDSPPAIEPPAPENSPDQDTD